ncbi:glutamine-synthetase adenylyltransferase [Kitasatospora cheerisanensis KCTC 2395]|uniref:Glutamine-synthetase adenylyltransferase n=1 Tax=Kitasatospora cheerisanensis KCTC 2395 TaxID=1348663 RepID=A0A066YWK2_9ACTN|nr:glutamine-synthetase adenylyltransferase [Kitasatospora cheerisanensis KCTC 2395]
MEERAGSRVSRLETRLVRRGFSDPDQAVRLLDEPELQGLAADPVLLDALGAAADPDQALFGLARLLEALDPHERHTLRDTLTTSKPLRDRLLGVLGASTALGDHLARHPRDWHALVSFELRDIHPGRSDFLGELARRVRPATEEAGNGGNGEADALRAAYRRCLLAIAARDLSGTTDLPQTAAELADLAGATLQTALDLAAAHDPEAAAACRLAVIGMGKCGGRELNYVSDVDVIFVAEPRDGVDEQRAMQSATRLAAHLMRLCSDTTGEGVIWPVDANLRPEGRNGPLVRTLASHLAYYGRWAKTWEFQALLKARPVAGDAELGRAYCEAVAPLVWQAAAREHFVADVQQMRRRVVDAIPAGELDRQLKLGPGGLRDVEFAVQLLQLVHGRTDESLRSGNTLEALSALSAGGYVGRADAASLDGAYRFLRTLEHRIQLHRLRRTHLMPTDPADLRRLARTMAPLIGDGDGGAGRLDPVAALQREWKRHAVEVRRLHERLFYRPLLDAVAELPVAELRVTRSGAAGLTAEAAKQRLAALGYADPAAALRHISALASGVSRKAAIQRTLLPVLLGRFADSADPDAGLLNFRQVSDALGGTPWYLRLLRDEGAAAEQLARVLSAGRFAPDLLLRAPEAVAILGDPNGLNPRGRAALESEILAAVGRAPARPPASPPPAPSAAANCSAPPPPTCSDAWTTTPPPRWTPPARRSPRSPPPPCRARCAPPSTAGRPATANSPPGSPSSAWAGSAVTNSATAPTRTCSSSTSRDSASSTRTRRPPPRPSSASCAPCSPRPPSNRRWRSTPTCGPRAATARWSAPSPRTPGTTRAGRTPGRARRCCGPSRWRATPSSARGSGS